jgi:type I restriction enzyme M protein
MEKLPESNALVEPISKQLMLILAGNGDKQAAANLVKQWSGLKQLQTRYGQYLKKNGTQTTIAKKNKAQHILRQHFDPFFDELHQGLKQLGKIIHHHVLKLTEEK